MDSPQFTDLDSTSEGFFGSFPVFFAVILLVIALVGVAVVVGGVVMALRARRRSREAARLRTEGRQATGVVVDNQVQSRHERRMTFAPIVRFEAEGREVVVVGDQRWNRSFVTGRPAQVVYDPAAPDRAHVRAEGGSVFGNGTSGIFLTVFGIAFLVLVGAMAVALRSVF